MNRFRPGRTSVPQRSERTPSRLPAQSEDILEPVLGFTVSLLLLARMLIPTESADAGDTLWIVQLWLGAGLIWCWVKYRQRDFHVRLDWYDLAVWLLVAGHVISAMHVVCTVGHKRAAVNMLWEWIGLGVLFFLVRRTATTAHARSHLLVAFTSSAIVLAGMGLWQHYVWYPQTVKQYEQLRQELNTLTETAPTSALTSPQERRLRQIQTEFMNQGIPLRGPERILWEQRLSSSREPFGPFALANTFAGVEVVWLIVLLGAVPNLRGRWRQFGVATPAAALMVVCILLTKSRTAWVGLVGGLIFWACWSSFARWRQKPEAGVLGIAGKDVEQTVRRKSSKVMLAWGAGGLAFVALTATVALTGGLDRFVLSQASKSMQYRLQYWEGTWGVIRERPILGTGPGNFRQHYLKHKLPESSEEIADPHNLVLDVWVNGGLVGLIGLLAVILAIICGLLRTQKQPRFSSQMGDSSNISQKGVSPWLLGGAASFFAIWLYRGLFDAQLDMSLFLLLVSWTTIVWLLRTLRVNNAVLAFAGISLLIHLLGAGGIGMPAVCQILLLLVALGTTRSHTEPPTTIDRPKNQNQSRSWGLAACTACLAGMFAGSLFSATLPVLKCNGLMQAADAIAIEGMNRPKAMRLYQRAAELDPISPRPYQRMAELAFLQWQNGIQGHLWTFDAAADFFQETIRRDPCNPNLYTSLGKWYSERYRRTGNISDVRTAERFLAEAHIRYPGSTAVLAELAFAAKSSGHLGASEQHAKEAVTLDDINHSAGHVDKYLPPETLDRLKRILAQRHQDLPTSEAN